MSGASYWLNKFREGAETCPSGGKIPPKSSKRRPWPDRDVPLIERLERLELTLPATSRRASMIRELLCELRQDATRVKPGKSSGRRMRDQIKCGTKGSSSHPLPHTSKVMEHYDDAFNVEAQHQRTQAGVDQRKAYIDERKARLWDHYQQSLLRPAGTKQTPEDRLVIDMLEGYDRRQLELEWRQPSGRLNDQLLLGEEYKEALTKFSEDAYGKETACEEKQMERRMITLLEQMSKLALLQRQHQGDYPDDVIGDESYFPSNLMDALQYKVDYYQKELLKIRQPPEEYQEAVAQFTEDAYGDETACGKQDMGKRKIELIQRINKLAVLEKKNRGVYYEEAIFDAANCPAALIAAMQEKVNVYEKKIEKPRHTPGRPVLEQNESQMLRSKLPLKLPDRTKSIDLIPEADSWLKRFRPTTKQYIKTKVPLKIPKGDKGTPHSRAVNSPDSETLMPSAVQRLSERERPQLWCTTHQPIKPRFKETRPDVPVLPWWIRRKSLRAKKAIKKAKEKASRPCEESDEDTSSSSLDMHSYWDSD